MTLLTTAISRLESLYAAAKTASTVAARVFGGVSPYWVGFLLMCGFRPEVMHTAARFWFDTIESTAVEIGPNEVRPGENLNPLLKDQTSLGPVGIQIIKYDQFHHGITHHGQLFIAIHGADT